MFILVLCKDIRTSLEIASNRMNLQRTNHGNVCIKFQSFPFPLFPSPRPREITSEPTPTSWPPPLASSTTPTGRAQEGTCLPPPTMPSAAVLASSAAMPSLPPPAPPELHSLVILHISYTLHLFPSSAPLTHVFREAVKCSHPPLPTMAILSLCLLTSLSKFPLSSSPLSLLK